MKKLILVLTVVLVTGLILVPAVLADSPGQERVAQQDLAEELNIAEEENLTHRNHFKIHRSESQDSEEFDRRGRTEEHKLEKIEQLEAIGAITESESDELVALIEEKQNRAYGACLDEDLEEVQINMRKHIHDNEDERFGAGYGGGRHH